jgi:imidazole glycerol phosphate synthase glutamine amidotransferase subunit
VERDRPLLAVCLGLQLLTAASEESPGVSGIGAFEAVTVALVGSVRVPQMGWNRVLPDPGSALEPGFAYFANGFTVARPPAGTVTSWVEYGGRRVAALERGATLACQFHPELSGAWGGSLLARWVQGAGRVVPC